MLSAVRAERDRLIHQYATKTPSIGATAPWPTLSLLPRLVSGIAQRGIGPPYHVVTR